MLEGENRTGVSFVLHRFTRMLELDHRVRMAVTLRFVALCCRRRPPAGPSKTRARRAARCRQPKAQNLPKLLLWGDDSKAVVSAAIPGRGESEPPRHNRDQLRTLFPN